MRCSIVQARELCAGVFSIWLEAPGIARAIQPGQFLNVKVSSGVDPLLRRPISVADVEAGRVRLVFRVVGRGTAMLSHVRAGDELDVLGPLGRPAPEMRGQDVIICGGGIGAAPLLFLARRLANANRLRVFVGASTKAELLLLREFRGLGMRVAIATDDGSAGHHGVVTELVEAEVKSQKPKAKSQDAGRPSAVSRQPSVVFACGPRPMLADLVKRLDPIPVWGFVEERMGCGTGICYCCALPKKGGGHVRFCEEGPVVRLNEVVL
ncbi:MAG: dihydroorotate dehydrogenase electron transfer subunit [candidate division WOR-3 bacterium]|nr:dihydroorotate dehydrogenase electron transfer subunit [candidate division WOR-3 bacterium]